MSTLWSQQPMKPFGLNSAHSLLLVPVQGRLSFLLNAHVSSSRQESVQHLKDGMPHGVAAHHGHQAEIDITSESTARATWVLHELVVDMRPGMNFTGFGYYEDEYVKKDGNWKIKSSKVAYDFTEMVNTWKSSK